MLKNPWIMRNETHSCFFIDLWVIWLRIIWSYHMVSLTVRIQNLFLSLLFCFVFFFFFFCFHLLNGWKMKACECDRKYQQLMDMCCLHSSPIYAKPKCWIVWNLQRKLCASLLSHFLLIFYWRSSCHILRMLMWNFKGISVIK